MADLVEVSVLGVTDVGKVRRANQDAFFVADLSDPPAWEAMGVGAPAPASRTSSARDLAVGPDGLAMLVADGMGSGAGGIASHLAVRMILQVLRNREASVDHPNGLGDRMVRAIEAANGRVHAAASEQPELNGMGTTATLAVLHERTLFLAHVGDSRAYSLRDGVLRQLTRDQSLVQHMIDQGELSSDQARNSNLKNLVLQAVGVDAQVTVAFSEHGLLSGDRLLLCSDGLHGQVTDREIESILTAASGPTAACDELVASANRRGGPDNVTVIVLEVA